MSALHIGPRKSGSDGNRHRRTCATQWPSAASALFADFGLSEPYCGLSPSLSLVRETQQLGAVFPANLTENLRFDIFRAAASVSRAMHFPWRRGLGFVFPPPRPSEHG